MKLVSAIIRPERLGPIQNALAPLGIHQMTLIPVHGQGHEKGRTYSYRMTTVQETRVERLKLEIAVEDNLVNAAIDAIQVGARTGKVGDGVILVTALETFVRIRTGMRRGEVRWRDESLDLPLTHEPPALPPSRTLNRIS
jgi:nitrogen regulatory protein PII